MSIKQILYEREHFSMQKLSDTYGLNNIKDYKIFLGQLMDKGIIPDTKSNRQILEEGCSHLIIDDDGLCEFTCSFYDWLIWDNYGLYFKPENGNKNKLKSNMELMVLNDFIMDKEDTI